MNRRDFLALGAAAAVAPKDLVTAPAVVTGCWHRMIWTAEGIAFEACEPPRTMGTITVTGVGDWSDP